MTALPVNMNSAVAGRRGVVDYCRQPTVEAVGARRPAEPRGDDFSRVEHVERVEGVRWGEASRRAAKRKRQFERTSEMTKKLLMMCAAVAVAIGARAETEAVGGYT